MFLYSKTILSFISRLKKDTRLILQNEMGLKTNRSRFEFNRYLVPFHIVVFEKGDTLGFFDHHTFQIGIHKNLMYTAKTDVIKNILRHELAHLMNYLINGKNVDEHGTHYREICKKYSWDKEVYQAKANVELENSKIEGDIPSEKIIAKVKKLLNLASSSNSHEAELATIKANQLLIKHNLNKLQTSPLLNNEEEITYVKRVITAKKNSAKYQTIYEILKTFFVAPVFNYGKGLFYLEVTGSKVNVELAEYVAKFLDLELERLYKDAQKNNPNLKGITKKNSFMRGIAKGYIEKINQGQKEIVTSKELVLLRKNLQEQVKMVYSRLGHNSSSTGGHCMNSSNIGQEAGKNLNIRPGVKSNSKKTFFLT